VISSLHESPANLVSPGFKEINQSLLSPVGLSDVVMHLGLSRSAFEACLATEAGAAVQAELDEGSRLGGFSFLCRSAYLLPADRRRFYTYLLLLRRTCNWVPASRN